MFFILIVVLVFLTFQISGKKLIVSSKVDKSILGGLIIDFDGEHYVDMSIRTQKFTHFSNLLPQLDRMELSANSLPLYDKFCSNFVV